ncbi:MAG: LysM peptidoglycan-binding domain-containing protein, partial [Acidobacteriota bacterium]
LWPDPPGGGFIDEGFPDYITAVTAEKDKDTFERVRSYTYGEFRRLIQECLQRMAREGTKVPDFQVTPVSGGSLPPTGGSKRYHIVRSGEWLSKIAQQYYGDPMKYTVIHKANLSVIGPNPDIIEPNQKLEIPYI